VDGKEYAMKDYWVDAAQIENEVTLLRMVAGIPNVVQLVMSCSMGNLTPHRAFVPTAHRLSSRTNFTAACF